MPETEITTSQTITTTLKENLQMTHFKTLHGLHALAQSQRDLLVRSHYKVSKANLAVISSLSFSQQTKH